MERYDTLFEVIPMMLTNGFRVSKNCLSCTAINLAETIAAFEIDKIFRLTSHNNSDEIPATNGLKGTLLDAYSAYTLGLFAEMEPKFKSN